MTVSVTSPEVADMVPIEHEGVDRLVRTLIFAVPPASLADRPVRETLELCRLDGLEFFSSINRALARRRARVTQRVRLRWRRSRATVVRSEPLLYRLALVVSLRGRPATFLSLLLGGGSPVVGERASANARRSTTTAREVVGGRRELPTLGRRR